MITALVFTAFLAGAGDSPPPAAGQQPQGQGQVVAPKVKPVKTDDKDRVICRRDEAETGSHRTVRLCHTKAEWDEMTDEAQRLFREGGIQAVTGPIPGGDGVHNPMGGGGGGGPH